jgi:mannose-6-phosphate isomerase-like protein (cupin superfamily)
MADKKNQSTIRIIGPSEGQSLLMGFAVQKVPGEATGGAFSVVEHNLQPKALAAPMHTHRDVDELSYVLEGEIGALIGDQELRAGPGTFVLKPRGIPHTFWNAGSSPARLLEIIWPAGFERYFEELDQILGATAGQPDLAQIAQLADRYGLEMDFDSIQELMAKYGVSLGG